MNIAIVLPDGVGLKNYAYSTLIDRLVDEGHHIFVWHALPDGAIDEIKKIKNTKNISFSPLPSFKETKKMTFVRELISYSRLIFNTVLVNNRTLLINWSPNKKGFKGVYFSFIEFLGKFYVSKKYSRILNLERHYKKIMLTVNGQEYLEFLKENSIDCVLSTHQRSIRAIPAILLARKHQIRTVGAIFSWDNLPKARLNIRTDQYIVWSDHMKRELLLYYPEIKEDTIEVTSTPQFEFYYKDDLFKNKKTFFNEMSLDINRKVICFSGDDQKTSPYDHLYLKDLAEEVSKIPIDQRPQILFRRSPVDFSKRYDSIIEEYPKTIKVSNPQWTQSKNKDWAMTYPVFDDIILLNNIVRHCDAVINIGSTMALDFYTHKKPAIYINYDIRKNSAWSVKAIYKLQHFRSMPHSESVYWLHSKDEIILLLNHIFTVDDSERTKNANDWLNILVESRENASKNIKEFLVNY